MSNLSSTKCTQSTVVQWIIFVADSVIKVSVNSDSLFNGNIRDVFVDT